jgi:hypothetical protein
MHRWFPGAVLTALALMPAALEGNAADALQVQLPAPPPLVPQRPRPRAPLFPLPFPPAPQVSVPNVQPPAGFVTGTTRPACGTFVLVDPKIDPKFVKPVPDSGVKHTIRVLPVPVPCR